MTTSPSALLRKHTEGYPPPPRNCPRCGGTRLYKDSIRETHTGSIQRWLCRNCSYRFTERKTILVARDNKGNGKYASSGVDPGMKNLPRALTILKELDVTKTSPAGIPPYDKATMKGLLIRYVLWLEKEGYSEDCRYISCIRMLINSGANLLDPEDVKATIGKKKWKDGTKMQAAHAYNAMTKMLKLTWTMPKYTQEEILPFIPEEGELDQLIAGCKSKRMAAFLQTLKETFADPGEAIRLRWIDVSGNIVTINRPVKGHRPRQLQVSNRLLAMLNCLPKTSENIFPCTYDTIAQCFMNVRKSVAAIQQNPRLLKISFVTFRHWGGTMIAYYAKGNVLTVQKLLGHKNIRNTMKYIGMITFKDDEFEIATATTDEEIKNMGASGYEKYDERTMGAIHISYYRRPKRFSPSSGIMHLAPQNRDQKP